jgi:hypothetical protein
VKTLVASRALIVALVLSTLGVACSGEVDSGWELPSHGQDPAEGFVAAQSVAELELHGSCIYQSRSAGSLTAILLTPGWRIVPSGDEHRLVSPSGQTVASVGDVVSVTGGSAFLSAADMEYYRNLLPDGCPTPSGFWIGVFVSQTD